MYNTSQCSRGIPNKSDSEQKQDNFYYSSPKAATDMGVSSSESHDLTAFYEMLSASFGVLSQNTGFYPSLDRIVETTLGPLNLGPGGGSYNELISCLQRPRVAAYYRLQAGIEVTLRTDICADLDFMILEVKCEGSGRPPIRIINIYNQVELGETQEH